MKSNLLFGVRPEIGNKAHIDYIKRSLWIDVYESKIDLEVETTTTVKANFRCLKCDYKIRYSKDHFDCDGDEALDDSNGDNILCGGYGVKYNIEYGFICLQDDSIIEEVIDDVYIYNPNQTVLVLV